jgi:hypothetical protein
LLKLVDVYLIFYLISNYVIINPVNWKARLFCFSYQLGVVAM